MPATEQRPLQVLTPALSSRLAEFNTAARVLQRLGVRMRGLHPDTHQIDIEPEGGRLLQQRCLVTGFHRFPTAGSTRFTVVFQGVTLEWREPISYRDTPQTVH